jgi:hypothetical protein
LPPIFAVPWPDPLPVAGCTGISRGKPGILRCTCISHKKKILHTECITAATEKGEPEGSPLLHLENVCS